MSKWIPEWMGRKSSDTKDRACSEMIRNVQPAARCDVQGCSEAFMDVQPRSPVFRTSKYGVTKPPMGFAVTHKGEYFCILNRLMFDEPNEGPSERPIKPEDAAREKLDHFRMHAEFCAVYEGCRKFDAEIHPNLNADIARDIQRTIGRLEKSRMQDTPVIEDKSSEDAARILKPPDGLTTNDYHIHRRPGEVMMVRWLEGEQVESFYTRLQAHFDAALNGFRQEERQSKEWKQDPATLKYLEALDAIDVKMHERYLRELIKLHRIFVLSTQATDELDILHLTDFVMGVEPATIVGAQSAPPEDAPTEQDRAWFFKLFSLRGMSETVERMCFFTYLQKTEEGW
jgi:hypothetical protein